jgi:hypothetical protein
MQRDIRREYTFLKRGGRYIYAEAGGLFRVRLLSRYLRGNTLSVRVKILKVLQPWRIALAESPKKNRVLKLGKDMRYADCYTWGIRPLN